MLHDVSDADCVLFFLTPRVPYPSGCASATTKASLPLWGRKARSLPSDHPLTIRPPCIVRPTHVHLRLGT